MVDGSTNTLLAKVSGNSTVMLICMTDSGVCSCRPSAVHTHDRLNENTSSSATASDHADRPAVGPEAQGEPERR